MKKLFLTLLLVVVFFTSAAQSFAYVSVNGYYRRDGTYVRPHVRSNPNGLKYDNYSYRGGSLYNESYYDSGYSSDWYRPSYTTDRNYYYGKSLYKSYNNYDYDLDW